MGRELRRVPLDFDWPLRERWVGFVNPHRKLCPKADTNDCHGGYTSAYKWMDAICHFIALIGDEAAMPAELRNRPNRFYPHPYLKEWNQSPTTSIPRGVIEALPKEQTLRDYAYWRYLRDNPPQLLELNEELAVLIERLAEPQDPDLKKSFAARKRGDTFDRLHGYHILDRLLEVTGLPKEWGICPVCQGNGLDPEIQAAHDAWTRSDPPDGPGYQLWETVSEGSPISPVFADEESFVQYLIAEGYSEKAARNFTRIGWVMSAMGSAKGLKEDIHALDD